MIMRMFEIKNNIIRRACLVFIYMIIIPIVIILILIFEGLLGLCNSGIIREFKMIWEKPF